MQLITPLPRLGYSGAVPSGFCGGYIQGASHFEAVENGRTLVGWRVTSPAQNANCTIKVGNSPIESQMTALRPLDGSADDKFSFPCGRSESSFEAKEVRMPRGLSCDSCIIEVAWHTEKGKQSWCADISVSDKTEIQECVGVCQNGGICSNGVCMCAASWEGANCQYERETVSLAQGVSSGTPVDWGLILFWACLISATMLLLVLAKILLDKSKEYLRNREASQPKGGDRNLDQITDAQNPAHNLGQFGSGLM